jgi:hypothetical protein
MSGRQRRSAVPQQSSGVPVQLPVRVTRRLDTAEAWLRELATLYRDARRGRLHTDDASRLAYIAGVAAKLAKDVQELQQNDALRAAVEAVASGELPPAVPRTVTDLIAVTDSMVAASITGTPVGDEEGAP